MKRLIVMVFFVLGYGQTVFAQYTKTQGYCEDGNQQVNVSGLLSTTRVQRSYPNCTVTVYDSNTTNRSTIYSSASGGVLGNPFTAANNGQWSFYGTSGQTYDVQFSGAGITSPFTRTGWIAPGAGGTLTNLLSPPAPSTAGASCSVNAGATNLRYFSFWNDY